MWGRLYIVLCLAAMFIVGCAGQSSKSGGKKLYTEQEAVKMTYCAALTDNAYGISMAKLKGVSINDAKNMYQNQSNNATLLALVDKVYKEDSSRVWEYSLAFFKECAANLAGVKADRIDLGGYCNHNRMIASVTHEFKASDKPKQKAYDFFAKYKSKTVNGIIDQVYESSGDRKTVSMAVWNSCIANLSGK